MNQCKDGDLWELFLEVLAWRNSIVESTSIQWVKGHATTEHVNAWITTSFDKAGNDLADKAAAEAYDLPTFKDSNEATSVLAARARKYFFDYTRCLVMFASIIKEAHQQRDVVKKFEELREPSR